MSLSYLRSGIIKPTLAPTPIDHCPVLSDELGAEIWVKREDRQDDIGSGVKRRAIEATLRYLAATGKNALVADGVAQSNCLRALAHYASRARIPVYLVVRGHVPDPPHGNYLGLLRSGARIVHIADPAGLDDTIQAIVRDLTHHGYDPLVVPAGAAASFSVGGPMGLGCEISDQEQSLGVTFDYVVLPVGTAGTATGLHFSKKRHGARWSVIGVRIDEYTARVYHRLTQTFASALGVTDTDASGPQGLPFHLHQAALAGGYGQFSWEDVQESERLLSLTNLYFGPTYMLKALTGLRQMLSQGSLRRDARILLVHTGGTDERAVLRPDTTADYVAAHN
ncbi:1-aminocyclopropane-1-carboxylate deaminase/D-cysteine desulfhydrase [Rhodovibrio salinarum]|uniref:Tryptophan synthase beta chain-like PALP domain-containing protein n=1 Tax=Rhodovibrio salinarum TaxID=1087 RepID=A0A934QGP5_9PROT|nr:pyridoxal-phosphate dependent enzyme [Rhodovibrio salinarum]MBK1696230.1 hypothetical protein [Rhodovibrio salinarum]